MLKFEVIRWRNFLSTGNTFTEMRLDTDDVALVIGQNGSGKSTMIDALTFAIDGRMYRKVNKDQIINTINGRECEVELEFSTMGHRYRVRRGIKPKLFEIHRDDELIEPPAHAADYQRMLEDVMGLDSRSFRQVVVIGADYFVPFMRMKAAERRAFIEDVLNIEVFTRMRKLNRDRVSETKKELDAARRELDTQANTVRLTRELLDELKASAARVVDDHTKDIEDLRLSIKQAEDAIADSEKRMATLSDPPEELQKIKRRLQKLNDKHVEVMTEQRAERRTLSFYDDNDECTTCGQVIDEKHKEGECAKLSRSILTKDEMLEMLNDRKKLLDEQRFSLEQRRTEHDETQRYLRAYIAEKAKNEDEIERLRLKMKPREDQSARMVEVQQRLDDAVGDQGHIEIRVDRLVNELATLDDVNDVLADGGAKAEIVRQYVPIINEKVNHYLDELGFFVNFHLDEEFEEVIKSRHRDTFSYDSFSAGERARIDQAMLLTWRDVGRRKNSVATNLLIFDEVFDGSMDQNGADDLMRLLKGLGHTVIVISHSVAMEDRFENVYTFEKVDNFSHMRAA